MQATNMEITTMRKPNIFDFATSELSQDAFICWLLSWATDECKDISPELADCARELVAAFLRRFESYGEVLADDIAEIITVQVQYKRIDVYCRMKLQNGRIVSLIIEDKTYTSEHDDQLQRYLENIRDDEGPEDDIVGIYFKTGDQSSYEKVEEAGYKPFLRQDMLRILNNGRRAGVQHPIFLDYCEYLQRIEDRACSFGTLPLNEWDSYSWQGFYLELQKVLGGNWGYVPNQSGGFMGFWWHSYDCEDCEVYLQLDEKRFCFEIAVPEKSARTSFRRQWYDAIMQASRNFSYPITKPKRFGHGRCMTVAILDGDHRQSDANGILDLEATVKYLRKLEKVMDAAVQQNQLPI